MANTVALKCLGYAQIVGAAAATALAVPAGASRVLITVGAQAVRYRDDGANPTATIGMPLAVGATLDYNAQGLSTLRFIEVVAGTVLDMSFYGT